MSVLEFYDDLADLYHLIYEDWPASVARQGGALASLIRSRWPAARIVADVACGIGTQSLGLAAEGFTVKASDLSERAIARMRREAAQRGLSIRTTIDDMRRLESHADGSADVVIACDNAVPHLLSNDEIVAAFRQFRRVLRPGGGCVISVRDYALVEQRDLNFVSYGTRRVGPELVSIFQVWKFDGDRYQLNFYFVFDDGASVRTRVFRTQYYAVTIGVLMRLFQEAGFANVERHDGVLFQPVIVARR